MNSWQKLKRHKLETPPPLSETSSNLQLPEVIGEKVDKRTLRKTGRTEQFATRVNKEWLLRVKEIAKKENLKLVEVLEKMLENYEQRKDFALSFLKEPKTSNFKGITEEKFAAKLVDSERIKTINQPIQPTSKISFNSRSNDEKINNLCSFSTKEEQDYWITCNKPLFNKKKALCRSHNHQVWKRFNQFLKPKSVSGTAAWLGIWEDSGDWKYFWDLGEEKENNK